MQLKKFAAIYFAVIVFFFGFSNSALSSHKAMYIDIPLIIPDPDYTSQNDSDLIYREVVLLNGRKYWNWGSSLGKSLSNFATIQMVLADWNNKLTSAENAFWQDYARTGQVNNALKNEFAYWLHKRELWNSIVTQLKFATKQSGYNDLPEVFTLIFGNRRPNAFTLPQEIGDIKTPTIDGPPRDHIGSEDYRAYFALLSQQSYLLHCPCSPRLSENPLDKIAYILLYPFGSAEAVRAKIEEIEKWSEEDSQKINELYIYLARGIEKYRLSINVWATVDGFMAGRDPISEQASERFSQFLQMGRIFRHIDIDGPEDREGYIEMRNSRGSVAQHIIIAPQSHEELKRCIERNWNTIANFLFEINPSRALAIFENPSTQTMQFQKDLGYIAIIGCSSPQGLADERVPALLGAHQML